MKCQVLILLTSSSQVHSPRDVLLVGVTGVVRQRSRTTKRHNEPVTNLWAKCCVAVVCSAELMVQVGLLPHGQVQNMKSKWVAERSKHAGKVKEIEVLQSMRGGPCLRSILLSRQPRRNANTTHQMRMLDQGTEEGMIFWSGVVITRTGTEVRRSLSPLPRPCSLCHAGSAQIHFLLQLLWQGLPVSDSMCQGHAS